MTTARKAAGSDGAGANLKVIVGGVLAVAVVVALIIWQMGPSDEELLSAATLTPDQIRYVATRLLLDEDIKIREAASAKLVSIGEPAVPVLKEISLSNSDELVRRAVLEILLAIHPPSGTEVVGKLIVDSDVQIRRMAASAAGSLAQPAAGGAVAAPTQILQKGMGDTDVGVRLATVDSISRTRDQGSVPALTQALKDPDGTVRRHAARTLMALTGQDYSSYLKSE